MLRVLRTVSLDTIDRRSRIGVALRRIQEDLTAQLGGPEEVTPAQALLIEQVAIKAVITQAVGEWLLKQESPARATVARANATAARRHRAGPPGGRSPRLGGPCPRSIAPDLRTWSAIFRMQGHALLPQGRSLRGPCHTRVATPPRFFSSDALTACRRDGGIGKGVDRTARRPVAA
jgi:hypothetical protein